jgi:hypothetical protein
MFGHTRLSRWTIASSTPSPTVPSAMCFTVVHAVCRDEEGHERVHVILAHPRLSTPFSTFSRRGSAGIVFHEAGQHAVNGEQVSETMVVQSSVR